MKKTAVRAPASVPCGLPTVLLCVVSLVTGICACTNRTVLTERGEAPGQPGIGQVRVWFVRVRNGSLELVPVVRTVSRQNMMHDAVTELIYGPSRQEAALGLSSEIPRGTVLIGVSETGKEVELNLSRRFTAGGGGESLQTRLEQLSRTVSEAAPERKVYLDVEGKRPTETVGEGLEIRQPINM